MRSPKTGPWKWWIVTIVEWDWKPSLISYEIVKAPSSVEAERMGEDAAREARRERLGLSKTTKMAWVAAGQVFGPFESKPECAWQDDLENGR